LPTFRFYRPADIAWKAKALLDPKRRALRSKRGELTRVREELEAAKGRVEKSEQHRRKKELQQEIFQLEAEIYAAKAGTELAQAGRAGALPDFLVIGGRKCGTTFLFHLLTQHPLVQPAASKELHFFDMHFDEGTEWYRQFFPAPYWKDGRMTITGEASPYMSNRRVPARMARVVPQARLIALLRNPVDRAYSDYQMLTRKQREALTFEKAIRATKTEHKEHVSFDDDSKYLSRGVYVTQLRRWFKFYPREQMLVLKSEDFFEDPLGILKVVLDFLDLPDWEPEASKGISEMRHEGDYQQGMHAATRRRLEDYFEPHNRSLYEFLGKDLGW
jgi:Sulfotransferase domain